MSTTSIIANLDAQTVGVLEKMAAAHNSSKEAIIESLAHQAAASFQKLEHDVQEGFDAIARGESVTHEDLLKEMRELGVDV